jgi:osmotically inducible protein OsmC
MAHVERTAEVVWSGTIARGTGLASGGSGAIRGLPITLASRFGAPEGKTSPEELIAAAHAGCFAMALGSALAGRGTPERLDVSVRVTVETSGIPKITSSDLDVHGVVPRSDPTAFADASHEAEPNCLVSRALQGNVEIRVHPTLEERPTSSAAQQSETNTGRPNAAGQSIRVTTREWVGWVRCPERCEAPPLRVIMPRGFPQGRPSGPDLPAPPGSPPPPGASSCGSSDAGP